MPMPRLISTDPVNTNATQTVVIVAATLQVTVFAAARLSIFPLIIPSPLEALVL